MGQAVHINDIRSNIKPQVYAQNLHANAHDISLKNVDCRKPYMLISGAEVRYMILTDFLTVLFEKILAGSRMIGHC